MDSFQAAVTSLAVIGVVLLMVVLVCHYLGPRATAWVRSNREEKIGLSKNKLFNANGYMIHSGSDFLLSSSGSFKRFDSIDRDYKQVGQSQSPTLTSPTWNLPTNDIPPQPLRPAPAPAPTQFSTKIREINEKTNPVQKPKSYEAENISTIIPRPVAKRQLSTPIKGMNPTEHEINLTNVVETMRNESRIKTNPFLNGSLEPLNKFSGIPSEEENPPYHTTNKIQGFQEEETPQIEHHYQVNVLNNKNPFTADCLRIASRRVSEPNNVTQFTEAPKTDIDRKNIFDFDFERVSFKLDEKTDDCLNLVHATDEKTSVVEKQQQSVKNTIEYSSSPQSIELTKYTDSRYADAFENIEKMIKLHFPGRNRSYSETEAIESDLHILAKNPEYFRSNAVSINNSTNPFIEKTVTMHKTFSENYLSKNNYQTWSFGRSISRQESSSSLTGRFNGSQTSLDSLMERGSTDSLNLQRAISCDSVSSESSVVLADLEPIIPPVTGYLCIGLQYDKNTKSDEGIELVVTVMEAKELIGPQGVENFDTFVRIYLVPDETGAMQTKLFKNSSSPSYNETFCFWLSKKRARHSLWFHLYHSGNAHTLIGEAEMQICDVTRPLTTWLPLSDSRHNNANWGELMFSLSYLPTAERLTVVVVKARNLKLDEDGREAIDYHPNIFVKVYLLKNDKKVSKKKTSLKRTDRCPIFNESMIFSIPPYMLNSVQVRLTVMSVTQSSSSSSSLSSASIADGILLPIGHVIVGGNTSGKGIRHWHQMLSSLRKPVAMWHPLRRTAINNFSANISGIKSTIVLKKKLHLKGYNHSVT